MKNLSQQIDSPPTQPLKKKDLKPTEVGWIPEDWELLQLKDCIKEPLQYGIGAAATDYNLNLPRYLRITDISEEGNLLEQNKASVDVSDYSRYLLKNDDIVLARTGASVGKSYHFNSDNFTGDIVFAGFLIKVSTDKNELSPLYLKYYLQSNNYWNWLKVNSMRSGQPGINSQEYSSLYIPLPPTLAEQRAIATALSDVDELIRALDALIQKKEAIKKGSMQQLLTGKQRLPGFEGAWEVKRLGDSIFIQSGFSFKSAKFKKSGTPIVRISNIRDGYIDLKDSVYYGVEEDIPRDFLIKESEALIAMSGATTGKVGLYNNKKEAYQNQRVGKFIIKDESKTDRAYILHLVSSYLFKRTLSKELEQGAQPNVSARQIEGLEFHFPNDFEEQKAIARILSDMDREIQVMRQKREKAVQIKQGMMQELLTGKTRLI